VFDFVVKCGNAKVAKAIFDKKGVTILASEFHILETIAIMESSVRRAQLKALTLLANQYSALPLAWRHAQELRFEIVHCRQNWINRTPLTGKAERFLRQHKLQWQLAQKGELPQAALSQYRNDSERGIRTGRGFQKTVRSVQVVAKKPKTVTNKWQENGQTISFRLDDQEEYWRADCAMSWYEAIVRRQPASRDYADFLDPYLKEDAFVDGTYASFWKNDANPQNLPLNRITGLTSFFQLNSKIGHGNAYDALHANYASDCDIVLTCDKAFFTVLSNMHQFLGGKFARPLFIDRSVSNVNAELEQKLDSVMGAVS